MMPIEERIKRAFTLEHPKVVVSTKNFEELSTYANWVGLKPDERGRIHLQTALGGVLVHLNELCPDDRMFIYLSSRVLWNCPFALWNELDRLDQPETAP